MLLAFISVILCFKFACPDPSGEYSSSELDSLLRGCAFSALVRPRTGVLYNGTVPGNLTGIQVGAARLRSGSLRRRGFAGCREFRIPSGIVVQPYVVRLVLVYHNLGNWSSIYYPLPGYGFLTPVLGLLAYDGANLSAMNSPELDIRASRDMISVQFLDVLSGPASSSPPKCVYFGLDGSVVFDTVINGSTCLGTYQGHFSIVAETSPAPTPAPAPVPAGGTGAGRRRKMWIIVGSVVGGAVVLIVLIVVFGCLWKYLDRTRIRGMEEAAESSVALPMRRVGNAMAPAAMETRTRPVLENELLP